MAQVSQTNLTHNLEKITVVLSKPDYMTAFNKTIQSYCENIMMPGFRKGEAPAHMVKQMHGKDAFRNEVLRAAGKVLDKHIKDSNMRFFARPMPMTDFATMELDYNNPQQYIFDFEIGLQPEFAIPAIDNAMPIDFYKVTISEAMIDEELEKIRYRAGNMTEPASVEGNDDDVLNITLTRCMTDGTLLEGAEGKANSLLLKYFIGETKTNLIGKINGDLLMIKLSEALDEKVLPAVVKDLGLDPNSDTDKHAYFSMTLDKIGHVEKAIVDEGLFEDVYKGQNVTTLEDFRNRLKSEIQVYWDEQSRTRMHNDMFETLVHETPIDLPVAYLKKVMRTAGDTPKTEAEVDAEYPAFEHNLVWQLVSEKLMTENKITATKAEMEDVIKTNVQQYFLQMGMDSSTQDASWLQGIVDTQMADNKYREETFNKIITDKLFAHLETKIPANEVAVSLDEFIKMPSKHHHHH
jgi:trigger factor